MDPLSGLSGSGTPERVPPLGNHRLFTLCAFGVASVGVYLFSSRPTVSILVLGLLVAAAELGQVVLAPGRGVSLGAGITLGAGHLLGAAAAGWIELLGTVLAGLATGTALHVLVPRVFIFVTSAVTAVAAGQLLMARYPPFAAVRWAAVAVAPAIFLTVNTLLLSGGLALAKQTRFWSTWRDSVVATVPQALLYLVLSAALVATYRAAGILGTVILCLGAVVVNRSVVGYCAEWSRERAVRRLLRGGWTGGPAGERHCQRVVRYAVALGEHLGLPRAELEQLRYAALLHDIGVDGPTWELLLASRALTPEEMAAVRQHPVRAAQQVARFGSLVDVARTVRHHHERHDGQGYPAGLGGEDIPLAARILTVADAFDRMTAPQPHRPTLTVAQALTELEAGRGSRFCPRVVRAFVDLVYREDPACSHAFLQRLTGDLEEGESGTITRLRRYVCHSRAARAALGLQPGPRIWWFLLERWGMLRGDSRDRWEWFQVLYDMARVLGFGLELGEVLAFLCGMASRVTGRAAAILLADDAGERLVVREVEPGPLKPAPGLAGASLDARSGLLGQALREGRPVVSRDTWTDRRVDRPDPFAGYGMRSLAVVPFLHRGRAVGALVVWDERVRLLPQRALRLLTIMAHEAALAVDNARLLVETRERLAEISAMKSFTDMVLNNIVTGILVIDSEGAVQLLNREARRVLPQTGLPEGKSAGDYPGLEELLLATLDDGRDRTADSLRVAGGDQERVLEVLCSPLRDPQGVVTGAVALFRDITDRKRLEEQFLQAEKLALVGELAAGAAHEIRNPLTCIRGFIQLLKAPGQAPQISAQYLDIILSEIDRIDGIVRDLLQLARPPDLALRLADPNDLVDQACMLFTADAARRGVSLLRSPAPDLPPVLVDPSLIKQVFINIIHNALQAVRPGGTVEVSTGLSPDRSRVAIAVRDDGPGIPPEIRDRIFNPFFTTRPQGTGLGLYVSYGIVRHHGGQIEVESTPGCGATFRVLLQPAEVISPDP